MCSLYIVNEYGLLRQRKRRAEEGILEACIGSTLVEVLGNDGGERLRMTLGSPCRHTKLTRVGKERETDAMSPISFVCLSRVALVAAAAAMSMAACPCLLVVPLFVAPVGGSAANESKQRAGAGG